VFIFSRFLESSILAPTTQDPEPWTASTPSCQAIMGTVPEGDARQFLDKHVPGENEVLAEDTPLGKKKLSKTSNKNDRLQ
jgi:hypothetical protein